MGVIKYKQQDLIPPVDSKVSIESDNPISNKAITNFVNSKVDDKISGINVTSIWAGTKAEYEAIEHDPQTYYLIIDA